MMVFIEGRNLYGLAKALRSGTAKVIRRYDKKRWERPKNASAPIIESIDITTQDLAASIAQAKKKVKAAMPV